MINELKPGLSSPNGEGMRGEVKKMNSEQNAQECDARDFQSRLKSLYPHGVLPEKIFNLKYVCGRPL
jgi:hypothetical protein